MSSIHGPVWSGEPAGLAFAGLIRHGSKRSQELTLLHVVKTGPGASQTSETANAVVLPARGAVRYHLQTRTVMASDPARETSRMKEAPVSRPGGLPTGPGGRGRR